MKAFVPALVACFLVGAGPAVPDKIEKIPGPVLQMRYTGSWGEGLLRELSVEKNGTFTYSAKGVQITGQIPADELKSLISSIAMAGKGPGAEDADYVEFKWIDADGKAGSRDYSYPREDPCRRLLKQMEGLLQKYGKTAKK
jgi:hypothetical protein